MIYKSSFLKKESIVMISTYFIQIFYIKFISITRRLGFILNIERLFFIWII